MRAIEFIEHKDYHKGWQHGSYKNEAEMVPTKWLARLKGNDLRYDLGVKANIGYNPDIDDWEYGDEDALIASLKKGVQEPVMIVVGLDDGIAYIGEGNHRVAAALKGGIDHLPARVYVQNKTYGSGARGQYRHDVRNDLTWDPDVVKNEPYPKQKYFTSPSQVFKSLQTS